MPADPNIILQAKAPDINPLDTMAKAYSIKNLMAEGQMNQIKLAQAQRDANDQQSLRSAYKNNTQTSPDGTPVVDRQGMMKDLMASNPMLAQKQAMDFRQMDLDKLNQQHAAGKSILFGPMDSQEDLDNARAQAKHLGLPPLPLPASIDDPNFQSALRSSQIKSLTAEEQLAQANKGIEQSQAQQKIQNEKSDLDMKRAQFGYTKQFEANQQVQQALESGRQAPDAQQALKDVYAAKKVNTLVEQGKNEKGELDPNKLNPQQVKLIAGEVGKIATGGAPTMDELHGLTPSNVPQILAGAAEKAFNNPTGAEAGEFVKLLQNYSNSVAADGKQLLVDRARKIVDQRKDDLGPKNYQNYLKNIDLMAVPEESSAKGPTQKESEKKTAAVNYPSDVTSYASKHGITPQQAAAIKVQRTKLAGQ